MSPVAHSVRMRRRNLLAAGAGILIPGGTVLATPGVAQASDDYPPAQLYLAAADNYTTADRENIYDINYVVIHTTQGSADGTLSWFRNSKSDVSAHYVIRSNDGKVWQCVRDKDIAWHAGNWNYKHVVHRHRARGIRGTGRLVHRESVPIVGGPDTPPVRQVQHPQGLLLRSSVAHPADVKAEKREALVDVDHAGLLGASRSPKRSEHGSHLAQRLGVMALACHQQDGEDISRPRLSAIVRPHCQLNLRC